MKNNEIAAQIETALQVKMRYGYTMPAVIHKLWHSKRKFTLGFNFKTGVKVGDVCFNNDGTRCEVLAIVD